MNNRLINAFRQRNFPVNPTPFANAIAEGCKKHGTAWITSNEARALLHVLNSQCHEQLYSLDAIAEYKHLNEIIPPEIFEEEFKVAAVSSNTNSFGLKQFVLVARSGVAYKACANSLSCPEKGDLIRIQTTDSGHDFTSIGYEIPERIERPSEDVLKEIWGNLKP